MVALPIIHFYRAGVKKLQLAICFYTSYEIRMDFTFSKWLKIFCDT